MITLTTEQAQQIEEALEDIVRVFEFETGTPVEALATIRTARAQEQAEQPVSQEYQDHLVNQSFDWAAMAAKHQFMEGYRIGLAEMREKCAKACEEIEQDRWNLYKGRPPYTGSESGRADPHEQGVSMGAGECVAAIRAIKFEGDTGFRPVSEMIAEHKQDPKKAAAIEKAKMRKAEQEPVAWGLNRFIEDDNGCQIGTDDPELQWGKYAPDDNGWWPLYTHPVRTKDLTEPLLNELQECRDLLMCVESCSRNNFENLADERVQAINAVIAAFKEKNK